MIKWNLGFTCICRQRPFICMYEARVELPGLLAILWTWYWFFKHHGFWMWAFLNFLFLIFVKKVMWYIVFNANINSFLKTFFFFPKRLFVALQIKIFFGLINRLSEYWCFLKRFSIKGCVIINIEFFVVASRINLFLKKSINRLQEVGLTNSLMSFERSLGLLFISWMKLIALWMGQIFC